MPASKGLNNLIEELKRRRVFRVATIYVVATWPIIQIADILSPALNVPDGSMRTILILFITGFPITLALSWIYNLTPKGLIKIERDEDGKIVDVDQRLIGKKTEIFIIATLLVTAGSLVYYQDKLIDSDVPISSVKLATAIDASTEEQIKSIAVLPFVPFSENKQDEYFADGLSEELLNVLSKIKTLRVVARTSSFAYKGVSKNIQEVGKELGVEVILEGSVRRNDIDNTIRVTAQLIDIKTGTHIWSKTYDRKFTDVFKIQDEITAAVVDELKITLLGEEKQQILAHGTTIPDAMVAHSRGRTELAKRTSTSIELAEQYFAEAVNRDPTYATAYASLAEAQTLQIPYSGKPREEYIAKAQKSVDRALKLDSKLGLAWAAQGLIYMSSEDMKKQALSALEKAIELNPSYAMANMWYGNLQEDNSLMMKYHQKAFQLDPKSAVAGFNVASNLVRMGKDREAMEVFSQIVEADPFYPGAYNLVAIINKNSGRVDQAIIQYKKAYELGESWEIAMEIANLYLDLGDVATAREWMGTAKIGAPESYSLGLNWLEISALLVEGKRDKAAGLLRQFSLIEKPNLREYYNAVSANYWLMDFPEAVNQFEKGEALRKKLGQERMLSKQMNIYIYASYAYQQLEQIDRSKELNKIIYAAQDDIATSGERASSELWYGKSLVQALGGDTQMALITLQRAIDEGWTKPWQVREEPILKVLKNDENFKAMLAGLQTKMNLMKEQLVFEESFSNHWKS